MSKNTKNLMEEWKQLRQEGDRKHDFVERLVLTTIAGNLAIYSFAFSLHELAPLNAFIALLPIFLTTMSYFWILGYLYSGLRIIRYIKEKLEPDMGLGWEDWIQEPREKIQPGGTINIKENIFCLFYHFFLVVSLLLSIILIWAPLWPYGDNSTQSSAGLAQSSLVPPTMCLGLTFGIVLFWFMWYLAARRIWISRKIEDIENLNQELRRLTAQERQ